MQISDLVTTGFYYLASPYSHPDAAIVQWRVNELRHYQALLMKAGVFVFPAVGACHEAAVTYGLPGDHHYWMNFDRVFINASVGVLVCCILGVWQSKGVAYEIDLCKEIGKPVWMLEIVDDRLRVEPFKG